MSSNEINNKPVEELLILLEEFTNEQIKLKVNKSIGQLNSPHRLRIVRRNIARVKTLLRLHELNSKVIESEVA